jgi:hypothetical protein
MRLHLACANHIPSQRDGQWGDIHSQPHPPTTARCFTGTHGLPISKYERVIISPPNTYCLSIVTR